MPNFYVSLFTYLCRVLNYEKKKFKVLPVILQLDLEREV